MAADPIVSDEITRFVAEHIYAVWMLEAFLFLGKCDAQEPRTAAQVARELRSQAAPIEGFFGDLVNKGILERHLASDANQGAASYRLAPNGPAKRALIDALDRVYRTHPRRIIDLIFADRQPDRDLQAIRSLANAFRITGDGKNRSDK